VERGFGAVMIEADPKKFAALVQTALKYPSIKPVNAEVTKYNAALLERLFFPTGAAVLNIDIDGDDSGVWRAIGAVAEVAVIEWCDHGIDKAVEVLAVAEDLGYVLAAQTNSNMIFVREGK